MKTILFLLFGVLMALPVIAANGDEFEYTYEGKTLTYTVIDEKAKTCMPREGTPHGYPFQPSPGNEVSGDLVIPSVANGYTVTSIGQYAFCGCSDMTSVSIPNSVTSFGSWAFIDCSGLTSVIIPNSITSISWGAFQGCSGLTSVTIPSSVTSIEGAAFCDCSGLTSFAIPVPSLLSDGEHSRAAPA